MRFDTSSKPGVRKRRDEPLNITTLLLPGDNTIAIQQVSDPSIYAIALYIVYKKTEERLIEEIKGCNILSIVDSKEFISRILRNDDEEIQAYSIIFSIKCPITKTLMEIPVRGINCKHIQCFNLAPYIQLQRHSKVNRWKCPICSEYVYDIIIDMFISQIIDEAKLTNEPSAIEIFTDCKFKIVSIDQFSSHIAKTEEPPLKRTASSEPDPINKQTRIQEIIEID